MPKISQKCPRDNCSNQFLHLRVNVNVFVFLSFYIKTVLDFMCVPYFVRKMHKKFKKKAQNFVFQEVSDETGRWTIAEDKQN